MLRIKKIIIIVDLFMAKMREIDPETVFEFLAQFSWLHSFPVINYFTQNIGDKIPSQWKDFLGNLNTEQLNMVPFEQEFDNTIWPESLISFVKKCQAFSLDRDQTELETTVPIGQDICRGMSAKKLHEVKCMAVLVDDVCTQTQSNIIVDVGSGLGYLGHVLHKNFGHPVIGLEGSGGHVERAEKRSAKQDLSSDCVKTMKFDIQPGEDNFSNLTQTLQGLFPLVGQCPHIRPNRTKEPMNGSLKLAQPEEPIKSNLKISVQEEPIGTDLLNREYSCRLQGPYQGLENENELKTEKVVDKTETDPKRFHFKNKNKEIRNRTQRVNGDDVDDDDDEGTNITQSSLEKPGQKYFSCDAENEDMKNSKSLNSFNISHQQKKLFPFNSDDDKDILHMEPKSGQYLSCCYGDGQKDVTMTTKVRATPFCIVGLHCCGDLTPTVLKYFANSDSARSLCVVGCCYHKMAANSDSVTNFPMSKPWRSSYSEIQSFYPGWEINTSSLRLAAQETRSRWISQTADDHNKHMMNVGLRALLELFLKEVDNDKYIRDSINRKKIRKADFSSFQAFVSSVLPDDDDDVNLKHRDRLFDLYRQFENEFKHIETFTCLQVLIQPVLESVICLDRQAWLHQQNLQAEVVPIFNDKISPRNLAIIAKK